MEHDFMLSELMDALHKCLVAAADKMTVYELDMATIAVERFEQAALIVHGYRRMPHWPNVEYPGWQRCQFDVSDELAAAAAAFMQRVRLDRSPW